MTEEWRDVAGYEGLYQVSNYGNVRALERVASNGQTYPLSILTPRTDKSGDMSIRFSREGVRRRFMVGRLVLEAFDRPPGRGFICFHKDGDKENNHLSNLCWVTRALNEHDVRRIRDDYSLGGVTHAGLAARYRVSVRTITYVLSHETWKGV